MSDLINDIKIEYNKNVKFLIKQFYVSSFKDNNFQCLPYLFVLIERMIIELCDAYFIDDIEKIDGSSIKTVNSIIKYNEKINKFLDEDDLSFISKIYCEEGLRNVFVHEGVGHVLDSDRDIGGVFKKNY